MMLAYLIGLKARLEYDRHYANLKKHGLLDLGVIVKNEYVHSSVALLIAPPREH